MFNTHKYINILFFCTSDPLCYTHVKQVLPEIRILFAIRNGTSKLNSFGLYFIVYYGRWTICCMHSIYEYTRMCLIESLKRCRTYIFLVVGRYLVSFYIVLCVSKTEKSITEISDGGGNTISESKNSTCVFVWKLFFKAIKKSL